MHDKGGQFEVGIGDATLRIVETYSVHPDVLRPRKARDVVNAALVGFYPDLTPPKPEALANPISVGCRWTVSVRKVGRRSIYAHMCHKKLMSEWKPLVT